MTQEEEKMVSELHFQIRQLQRELSHRISLEDVVVMLCNTYTLSDIVNAWPAESEIREVEE